MLDVMRHFSISAVSRISETRKVLVVYKRHCPGVKYIKTAPKLAFHLGISLKLFTVQ